MPAITLPFRRLVGLTLQCDVHLPTVISDKPVGCLLHWHGGGLTSGSRSQLNPTWLVDALTDAGCLFISPDYRLLSPSTGHDILEDALAIIEYVFTGQLVKDLATRGHTVTISLDRVMLGGQSAGGLLVLLAALHSKRRFLCLEAEYPCGGSSWHLLYHNSKRSFFTNRETHPDLDLTEDIFSGWRYPQNKFQAATCESESRWDAITGRPSDPRMMLMRFYLHQGVFLDVYTGEDGLSDRLRQGEPLPERHRRLFPMLATDEELKAFPETVILHGTGDTVVLYQDSVVLVDRLKSFDILATVIPVQDGPHGGDLLPIHAKIWAPAETQVVQHLLKLQKIGPSNGS